MTVPNLLPPVLPDDPFDDFILPDDQTAYTPAIPYSREAEEMLLGALLIYPQFFQDISEFLKPDDFYIHRHRWIWEAMDACLGFGRPIDMMTVSDVLDGLGQLVEMGGPAYLTQLIAVSTGIPTLNAENIISYGRIIEAHSVRRKLITKANNIAALAYDESKPIEDTLAEYDKMVAREDVNYSQDDDTQDSDEASIELLQDITSNTPTGIMTGFPEFDKIDALGGLPVGATLMIGDSSFGKSAWWLQVCEQVALAGSKSLYFGLESTNKQNVLRRVGGLAGVNGKKVRSGSLTQQEQDDLRDAIVNNYQGKYGGRLKFNSRATSLRSIERAVRLYRPDLFVVDQINQVEEEGGQNKTVNMLHNFTMLKNIANKYDCACGVVHAISPEESAEFFKRNQKAMNGNGQKNQLPDLNAIPWAKQIKHITDVMLILMPEVNQQLVGAKNLKISIWIMKDRDGNRFTPTLWDYDLMAQWFTDKVYAPNAQRPSHTSRLP